ncbi:MAG: rod shape-determining protein RodA [Eggerthellaceae bacterium]|nr:rod shape-determining protein RodA [Eggerthellaceae bacterium]
MAESLAQIQPLQAVERDLDTGKPTRRFKYLNIPFLLVAALLSLYGLAVVYSAVHGNEDYSFSRQAGGVIVGAVLMLILFRVDYRGLSHYMVLFIIINAVLILMPHVPGIGVNTMGATSWVKIGPLPQLQPGEFAKITVILLDAAVVARYKGKLDEPIEFLKSLGIMMIPFVCIMTQPDLGTGLVYIFIAGIALLVGGAKPKFIIILLAIAALGIVTLFTLDPILDNAMGHDVLLKNYQRARLLVFLDNSYDPTGDGYNLQQAQIAIGSGGFFGKGYMQATQSTLGYLPEAPTDFIFCVLAEELGFVGAMMLLLLYIALLLICFHIAYNAADIFGTVIVMCTAGMWLFQILENIGMTCGLMPITGIPLPFVSFGSSFMVVNFMLLGVVGSVWAHSAR